jgi:predicted transcriptional regulator
LINQTANRFSWEDVRFYTSSDSCVYFIVATQALLETEVQKSNDKENLQSSATSKQTDENGELPDALNTGEEANATTDNESDQEITLKDILDEFTQQINLTFETFCNEKVQCKSSDGQDGSDEHDATSGDTNETSQCTLDQLESLKEKVQNKICTLLQDKGNICFFSEFCSPHILLIQCYYRRRPKLN